MKKGDEVKIVKGHGIYNGIVGVIKSVDILEEKNIYLIEAEGLKGAYHLLTKVPLQNCRRVFEEHIEVQ